MNLRGEGEGGGAVADSSMSRERKMGEKSLFHVAAQSRKEED